MSNASRRTPAKFCPRCGAFYSDLQSKTCPQCFSPLEVLSDDTAEALVAEQESRKRDPDNLDRKRVEDEKFKEQAFGGCFGLATIILLTVILSVVIVSAALHRTPSPAKPVKHLPRSAGNDAPPIGIWLPEQLAGAKRIAYYPPDSPSATVRYPEYIAGYANNLAVYCVPATLASADLTQFRESTDTFHNQKDGVYSRAEVVGHGLDYLIYAPTAKEAYEASIGLESTPLNKE